MVKKHGTSESLLSWREELINLVQNPPKCKPAGRKHVKWADLSKLWPTEPEPVSGQPKSCMKTTETDFDFNRESRGPSRSFPSPWRDTVWSRCYTPRAPERPLLSRLRDMPTSAPQAILKGVMKLTETKWEEVAETGTFLVDPVKAAEPGRLAWPDTPMIQRHYTPVVERNLQEILQQTFKEIDLLRETALIKPECSRWRRCWTWLKEKVLRRPMPKKSCIKQARAERVSEDEAGTVRYFISLQMQIGVKELNTKIRTTYLDL